MQIMFDMEHFCPYRAEVSYHKVCQICACERIQNKKKNWKQQQGGEK